MMTLRLSVLPCMCSGSHTQRSNRVTRRKELKQRSIIKKPKAFRRQYIRKGVKEVEESGSRPSNHMQQKGAGHPSHGTIEFSEEGGRISCKKLLLFSCLLSLFLEVSELEIEAELACMATLFGAEAV